MLKRMDRIRGRLKGAVILEKGHELSVSELDDVVFGVSGLLDYQAEIYTGEGENRLRVKIHTASEDSKRVSAEVQDALSRFPIIERCLEEDILALDPVEAEEGTWTSTGISKRKIRDLRL
jgi:phenylacetate-coenzyme A ligase PaaK-like adenylate-forming protein